MSEKLRILHLEDDPMDADLIRAILVKEAADCEVVCVQTREDFRKALEAPAPYDLILSDFSGPDFDGMTALRMSRDARPDTPFIFVSGSIGEDLAIDSLVGGATDYVLKERLKRLGPAVARAFREAKERREKKILEEKFLQAQKMEVVGQLAGGIAHDFNNLLAVILGHLDLLLERKDTNPKVLDSLKNIHQAAESAGGLTKQLLLLSRKQAIKSGIVDVNRVIAAMIKMLGRVLGGRIRLEAFPSSESLPVNADPNMLEQVLMNLVVNARDAMPQGGTITIRAERVELHGTATGMAAGRTGKFIRITVSDTGTGIPPEVMPRLFDPFFTTKEPGKGTGLGLSTVYGIVDQHHGWIEVKSAMGSGSEFIIHLPQSEAPAAETAPTQVVPAAGKETLLIAESDGRLRKQAKAFLEEEGYVILEAGTGAEALIAASKSGRPVDLLLTDLMLPDGMAGRELADQLRSGKGGLQVIYTSRYGLDMGTVDAASATQGVYLPKPYDWLSLQRTVRRCLDALASPPEPEKAA